MRRSQTKKKQRNIDEEDENLDILEVQDHNEDQEYQKMLPNRKKPSANSYFMNSAKYQGTVKSKKQELEQQNQEELQIQSSEPQQQQDGIKSAIKQIKIQRNKNSRLLEETINAVDEQDHENLSKLKKQQNQYGNPQVLKNQLNQFSKMVEIRVYSQKNIEQIKRYPVKNFPNSTECHENMKEAEGQAISGLTSLIRNYQTIATEIFGQSIVSQSILPKIQSLSTKNGESTSKINVQSLWQQFQSSTKQITQKLETGLIEWSQKTTLLRNSTSKSHYSSLVMQTPIGQAKKSLKDWERVKRKHQLKRSPFRILFESQQSFHQTAHESIYNDLDLLQQLSKIYEQDIQKDDKQFLVSDTLKYLQSRNDRTSNRKDVDRKASKNRKIRFNVHPKLLNYMPCHIQNLLEAREQIVKNLFNRTGNKTDATIENQVDYIDM